VATKRLAVMAMLSLLIVGLIVFEDVIAKESGPVDTAILWFIRINLPTALHGVFSMTTLSGAGFFLTPATAVLCSLFFFN
jgi:hypothetical protein